MNQYEKIDYTQHPGVLHKNEKGEWGMYKEHFKNSTGVYWQPASKHQLENIYFLESYRKNRLKEYIKEEWKLYKFSLRNNSLIL